MTTLPISKRTTGRSTRGEPYSPTEARQVPGERDEVLLECAVEPPDDQIGAEVLAWFGLDNSGYLVVTARLEDDPARLPTVGAGHERAKIGAVTIDQPIAVNGHVTIEQSA